MIALWFCGAAIIAGLAVPLLRRSTLWQRLADLPNERSLHADPRPRVGGLAILAGVLPLAAWAAPASLAPILGVAAALALLSAIDDRRSLPIAVRLPAHLVAAFVAVLCVGPVAGIESSLRWVEIASATIAIAWMTNLYNFMDGADGLAGGMAVAGFGAYAIAALIAGQAPLALVAAAIAGASTGFLLHNFPPARVFLGDAGSIPLGFLAAALGLGGIASHAWAWWFPWLVFAPFIVDATVTLARRALRGRALWRAHREHAYQRLVLGGWSHRRLAIAAYVLMLACAASALIALRAEHEARYAIISFWVAAHAGLLLAIERRCPMAPRGDRQAPVSGSGPEQQG